MTPANESHIFASVAKATGISMEKIIEHAAGIRQANYNSMYFASVISSKSEVWEVRQAIKKAKKEMELVHQFKKVAKPERITTNRTTAEGRGS